MVDKPTFLRMPTENDAPYFASFSCAEILIDSLMAAQRRGWLQLHAFTVLPNAVELLATSLKQDIMGIKEYFQAQTTPLLTILLPKAANVWDRRFVVKWLDSQRAYDLQQEVMRCSPVDYRLSHTPELYPYSSAHPRYEGLVTPYMGFGEEAPAWAFNRVHVSPIPTIPATMAIAADR